jgi:hypothetical protein
LRRVKVFLADRAPGLNTGTLFSSWNRKFGSLVININAFIAAHPKRARAVFMTSRQTGLWQLDLTSERGRWTVGHYVDGLAVEHDIKMKLDWGGYVNEEHRSYYTPYVLWLEDDRIHIALPHKYEAHTVITAPQICGHRSPLLEPVYMWRDAADRFRVLECAGGLYRFEKIEELEDWINEQRCPEGHDRPLIHWVEWYVIGTVNDNEEWLDVVKRPGYYDPSSSDVMELVKCTL